MCAAFEARLGRTLLEGAFGDDPKIAAFCENLIGLESALWTFAKRENVEPTNNFMERLVRLAVLWCRRSFGCISEGGCRFVERVLTVVQTCRLKTASPLEFLTAAVRAHRVGQPSPSSAYLAQFRTSAIASTGEYASSARESSLHDAVETQAFGHLDSQGLQDSLLLGVRAGDPAKQQALAVGRLQFDVADHDAAEFSQDHLGCHRAWFGWGGKTSRVGFASRGFQVGPFGEMVERFPQRVGQHADEDVGLGPATVVMPDGTQLELPLQHAEGAFDRRELHVRFPKLFGGPALAVTAEQIGAVASQRVLEFGDLPLHSQ